MGVRSCFRPKCENILCDTYIDSVGYICYECEKEFKEHIDKLEDKPNTEYSILIKLKKFMDTEKNTFTEGKEMDVNEFFQSYKRD
jgi:hypothetical protein